MSNSLLTINQIGNEAIRLWENSNAFLQNTDQQYDDSFAKTGAKIGQSLRIRLPNDYTVTTGPALSSQDTSEQSTSLVVATQKHVDMSFSSVDRTMSLDNFSERVLAPAVNNLAGAVATDLMSSIESGTLGGAANIVYNADNSNDILSPTAQTYLLAKAILSNNSTPNGSRKVVNSPNTNARVVATLAGLFNPTGTIAKQYDSGDMNRALGFDWMEDQTVLTHTSGSFTTGAVAGAAQSGSTIAVAATTGTLNAGDFITIQGVYQVNRITKQSTGALRQFVVTNPVPAGATQIPIYPALVPAVNGAAVQYQTVTASPANNATISAVTLPNVTYRKNIAYHPQAITIAFADLEVPKGVHEAKAMTTDKVAMRLITAYNIGTDQYVTRLDVLYGYTIVRPEWFVVVADVP